MNEQNPMPDASNTNPAEEPDKNQASPVKRSGVLHWLKRCARFILHIVLLFFIVVLCAVGVAIASLVTETGRLFWLNKALPLVQTPSFSVVLDDVEWPRLGNVYLGYALVSLGRDPLLELKDAQLRVSLSELLDKRLLVHELSAARLVFYKPPAKPEEPDKEPFIFNFDIPDLPSVKVETLSVKTLLLRGFPWPTCAQCDNPQKTYAPGPLKIVGNAALHWPNPLELELSITEKGHKIPLLNLQAHSETRDSLSLTGRIQQGPGEWLGQWLKLPRSQAIDVNLAAQAEQKDRGIVVELDQLSAPLFEQKIALQGRLMLQPEDSRVELEQLILGVNQQRHTFKGFVSPELVALNADIKKFNLGLLQPWVTDLEGGSLSVKADLSWDWDVKHLPRGDASVTGSVRYAQQMLSLNTRLTLIPEQAEIKMLRANVGEMQLSAKGRVPINDDPMAITFTLTHLRDGPLREVLPAAIADQIPEELSVHAQKVGGLLQGTLKAPHVITDVNIVGNYRSMPFAIHGYASADMDHADIGQLSVEADDARIALEGIIDWRGDMTSVKGEARRLSPSIAYRADLPLPPGLVGSLNARWDLSGPLTQPSVKLDALYQGGYEFEREVLPFKLDIDASAKLGALKDIALDVDVMELSVFKRPLVTMKGQVNARDNNFRVVISRLPTQLLEALGYPIGDGRAEARLYFGGSFTEPTLGGYMSYAEKLAVRSASDERDVVPLIWHANVSSEQKDLLIDSSFTLDKTSAGLMSLRLPWHSYLSYLLNTSGGDLPTKGSVSVDVDTSAFQLFMDTDQMALQGGLEADLTLAGTAARPTLNGELLLKNGYFKQASTGTVLSDIQLYAVAEGQSMDIVTGFARDGESGTLRADGQINWRDLTSDSAIDIELILKDANLIDTANAKGAASGKVSLKGGTEGLTVAGRVNVQPLEINIDSVPAVSIPELDVEEVYEEEVQIDPSQSAMPTIVLDIEIDIENQAFIRGRGLETELEGKVNIAGTASKPDVTGSFKTVRGEIKLLQKPIKLNEGRAQFSNESFSFHIPATYQTGEIQINIVVSGTEEEINLDLTSVPSLPQEEILSRLLFGSSVENISAWEAMSLASAVNKIKNGGGFNPLDATRDKLGFDRLSVGQDSEEDGGGVNVGVGKYLNERVYLELERSSNPAQPWQGNLKIDLTDELRLNSSTGSEGKASAALEWRRDY